MKSTNLTIGILLLIIIGVLGYLLLKDDTDTTTDTPTTTEQPIPVEPDGGIGDGAGPLDESETEATRESETILGTSVEGSNLVAYHYGEGDTEILLINGIHGGYSWSTAALGYELVDYYDANPNEVPENIMLTIIPVANPDGLESAVGTVGRFSTTLAEELTSEERVAARFNANNVDLNRNFDCEWSAEGTWQSRTVSGGTAPFSEPEAAAIRDYVNQYTPDAAIVWFSAEGKVYPSACGGNPSEASEALAATFAQAANYPTEEEFDAYSITGDMVNWLAKQNVPAISVLLTSHTNTEFTKNLAGIEAVLLTYSN